ncbi:putative conserved secreted protein [Synechococcus sp. PROS-7-1]|uniref:hypothetical protein n=1 Tax=Synechococcus sp. PROS-7-1 TaxID=1442556 RepID=UPI001644EE71|nr:hypothetical protein [Synechococcus sp. PROS-7-1]QNI84918.1 putative conserved secreted protein [Synechococcus sp. PROS-7-1]
MAALYSLLLSVAAASGAMLIERPFCDGVKKAGQYFTGSNVFCLSTALVNTEARAVETLAHEMVHLAQDCAGGGLQTDAYALLLSEQPPSVAAAEDEAYQLERDPRRVLELVRLHCY